MGNFTQIPNEILEALCKIRISGEARQCLDVIMRKTYGFHKNEDEISLSQFMKHTGIAKSSVIRALQKLEEMHIIYKKVIGGYKKVTPTSNMYGIESDTTLWVGLLKSNRGLLKSKRGGYLLVNRGVTKKRHTIDTITKETNTKERIYVGTSEEVRLASYLYQKIKDQNPYVKPPNIQKWAKHIDLMQRVDNVPYERIEQMIDWCKQDTFWTGNILSTESLRKQFPKMYESAKREYEDRPQSITI